MNFQLEIAFEYQLLVWKAMVLPSPSASQTDISPSSPQCRPCNR